MSVPILLKAGGLIDAGIENFVHGSGETLAASIASAYENKEPWFGFYWGPTSVLGKYPMTLVEMGAHMTRSMGLQQSLQNARRLQ